MRLAIWDKFKSRSQFRKDEGKTCSIPGCNDVLTSFQGPGSDCLCREHQLKQVEYGGVGKIARPHTFHRNGNPCTGSLLILGDVIAFNGLL